MLKNMRIRIISIVIALTALALLLTGSVASASIGSTECVDGKEVLSDRAIVGMAQENLSAANAVASTVPGGTLAGRFFGWRIVIIKFDDSMVDVETAVATLSQHQHVRYASYDVVIGWPDPNTTCTGTTSGGGMLGGGIGWGW